MADLYPVTDLMVRKQGVLYPVTHVFIKGEREVPIDTDFSITVNSGEDASFKLPTTGRVNNVSNPYNWIVDWGDGTTSEHSGMGTIGTGITHAYPQANTLYKIKIAPQNPDEAGWLRAFGFDNSNTPTNKQKVMVVDGQLTEQMVRAVPEDTLVCACWFYGCTNLTMGPSFNLPQEIEHAKDYFCYQMFRNCTSLTMNSVFQLPQGITSGKDSLCREMFYNCTSLTMNSVFNLPQGITNCEGALFSMMFSGCTSLTMNDVFNLPQGITDGAGASFFMMFSGCTSLTMNDVFNLPQGITGDGGSFCYSMFRNCTSLTMNSVFQLPQGITSAGSSFCSYMFQNCTNLTMNSIFQLPQGITSVGNSFCESMFEECTSLNTGVVRFFGSLVVPSNSDNRAYSRTFRNCIGLTEALSGIPQLQSIPNTRQYTFEGCPAELIAPLHSRWK